MKTTRPTHSTSRNAVLTVLAAALTACSTEDVAQPGGVTDASSAEGGMQRDSSSAEAGTLRWFSTCGNPTCSSQPDGGANSGVAACTTEHEGDACAMVNAQCDPGFGCEKLMRCLASDPKLSFGGCPFSSRKFKNDVRYLNTNDLERVASDVEKIRLATYSYKTDPSARQHLGFIIEDDPTSPAVSDSKTSVDLYGYTSMVVAAMKVQAQRIERQDADLAALRRKVDALEQSNARRANR